MSKQSTIDFILDKVAPIFNRQGYVGTSLSDLTAATNLTKGAIYCNFENKEDLAIKAFKKNAKNVLRPLRRILENEESGAGKLQSVITYHRSYYKLVEKIGGCPVLNVGIDAKHNNPKLYVLAKSVSMRLMSDLQRIIELGIEDGSLKNDIDPENYAKTIYTIIDGGVYMTTAQDDEQYIQNVLDYLEAKVLPEIMQ